MAQETEATSSARARGSPGPARAEAAAGPPSGRGQAFPPEGDSGAACAGKRVILTLMVGEDGSVQGCQILAGTTPACAEAARKAAMRYRFKPALDSQGRPVKASTTIALEFPEGP